MVMCGESMTFQPDDIYDVYVNFSDGFYPEKVDLMVQFLMYAIKIEIRFCMSGKHFGKN